MSLKIELNKYQDVAGVNRRRRIDEILTDIEAQMSEAAAKGHHRFKYELEVPFAYQVAAELTKLGVVASDIPSFVQGMEPKMCVLTIDFSGHGIVPMPLRHFAPKSLQ